MQRPGGLALQLKVSPLVLVPSSTGAAWRSFVTTMAQVLEKLQRQLILTTVRAPSPRLYGQRPPSEAPWRSSRRHPPVPLSLDIVTTVMLQANLLVLTSIVDSNDMHPYARPGLVVCKR